MGQSKGFSILSKIWMGGCYTQQHWDNDGSEEDGDISVAFCFRSKPFSCSVTDMEKVPPFEVGQEIHVIPSVSQPRLGWSNESPATVGKIIRIDMDGTLNVSIPSIDLCHGSS